MKKPILIAMLGFPGSGKSYFSEHFSKRVRAFHINSDKTRHTLFEKPTFSSKETEGVFRLMELISEDLLKKGMNVIYDVNMNFKKDRKRLRQIARRSDADYYLVWIQTDIAVAKKRLLKRAKIKSKKKQLLYPPLDIEILYQLKNEMEHPGKSEEFIAIDGHSSFEEQFSILKKQIQFS